MKNGLCAGAFVLIGSVVNACDTCKVQYERAYVEETVVVKKPVWIKKTPIVETREKQVTVKEQVVTGYKEEVVAAKPHHRPFAGLFKRKCNTCE